MLLIPIAVTVFLLITTSAFAQFRWSEDSWFTKQGVIIKYDKIEHAVLGGCLAVAVYAISRSWISTFVWSTTLNCLWEIKDGFLEWERFGWIGGDGFSWKDFIASEVGILITMGFMRLMEWILNI